MAKDAIASSYASNVDPSLYRDVMGKFATGVTLVTTRHGGTPFGMAMNSLTSVSLEPCLLLICPRRGSATGEAIRQSGYFAISVLESAQADICKRFVGKDARRFKGLELPVDMQGCPVVPDSLAQISCRVHAIHPGGDHEIVMGEVTSCQRGTGAPLIFHEGRFLRAVA